MAVKAVIPMTYKVDWFQCTENSDIEKTVTIFNSKFWKFLEKIGYKLSDLETVAPRYFYNTGLSLGRYFNVYYDDESKGLNKYSPRNILVIWTGQGTTDLALKLSKYFKTDDFSEVWYEFFKVVIKLNLRVKRLDIALDDYNSCLSFDALENKLRKRQFKSSKRTYNIVKDKNTDGQTRGETIYLGTRKKHQNGYLIRFYNKYAEYKSKGAILPVEVENVVTGMGTHKWQRYEMELHGKACLSFIKQFLGGMPFGELYMGLMKNAIVFLDPSSSNKNRSYWEITGWWEDFLNGAKKCNLVEPSVDPDIGRLLRWVRLAVTPSLHLLDDIFKRRGVDVYELIKNIDVPEYAKKQERLKNEALDMSDEEIDSYITQFKRGEY